MALVRNHIEKQYVILCEGIDTVNFLIQYLNSKTLSYDQRFSTEIQVFILAELMILKHFSGH